ncbi:hypothetical protein Syun_013811 [Stephania yunnanensis]|uniref:Uncharacterized protein n=1 Tax=Stephania yunnanensis TaxID=152371 RepID=A0AAP0JI45_9MAGN
MRCVLSGAPLISLIRDILWYGDAASYDRVRLALPRLCDPDPVAPAFGGLELLGYLSILFHLTLISRNPTGFYLPGLGILVFDRVRSETSKARRRHLAIYSRISERPSSRTLVKDSFIQLFAITGILLLSMRSLGQKCRINDLQDENSALRYERDSLTERRNRIQRSLLDEAALDPTDLFASRLRVVFGNDRG